MNDLSFLLTLSYNVRLAFSLSLIFPQQHRILLLGHCCMYFILVYVFVYLICYRKKKKFRILNELVHDTWPANSTMLLCSTHQKLLSLRTIKKNVFINISEKNSVIDNILFQ